MRIIMSSNTLLFRQPSQYESGYEADSSVDYSVPANSPRSSLDSSSSQNQDYEHISSPNVRYCAPSVMTIDSEDEHEDEPEHVFSEDPHSIAREHTAATDASRSAPPPQTQVPSQNPPSVPKKVYPPFKLTSLAGCILLLNGTLLIYRWLRTDCDSAMADVDNCEKDAIVSPAILGVAGVFMAVGGAMFHFFSLEPRTVKRSLATGGLSAMIYLSIVLLWPLTTMSLILRALFGMLFVSYIGFFLGALLPVKTKKSSQEAGYVPV